MADEQYYDCPGCGGELFLKFTTGFHHCRDCGQYWDECMLEPAEVEPEAAVAATGFAHLHQDWLQLEIENNIKENTPETDKACAFDCPLCSAYLFEFNKTDADRKALAGRAMAHVTGGCKEEEE